MFRYHLLFLHLAEYRNHAHFKRLTFYLHLFAFPCLAYHFPPGAALVRNCSEKVGSFDIHHFGIAGAQFGKDYANLPRFIRELADRCGHAKLIVRW